MTSPPVRAEPSPAIRAFFARYAALGADSGYRDADELFAETFLVLDPNTCRPVARDQFVAALPRHEQAFAALGVERLELATLAEQPIDARHTLVTTTWTVRWQANDQDRPRLTVRSTFLLRDDHNRRQIVVYLNHDDLAARIRQLDTPAD
jgi:hypothetical protein